MSDMAPVAVVTGASRGAGLGIATALSDRGWQVYGTGRTVSDAPAWGTGIQVDHRDDDAVGHVFERVHA
ncbi:short-chain dehydrogenase, partial [Mycobacterium sp. ITM-2017-0098]